MKSSKKSKTTKNYTKKIGGNNTEHKSILKKPKPKKTVTFQEKTKATNGSTNTLKPPAENKAANAANKPPLAAENKAANANKTPPTEPKSNDKKGEVIQPGMEAGMPGMMPGMMPQQGTNEEENNNDNKMENDIKPLGSPSLYGAVVLGLFSFAAYLQFSAFRDKQV